MNDNQEKINLGQAKNQAVEKLKSSTFINLEQYEVAYKEWTIRFYKWNKDIDKEVLETKESTEKLLPIGANQPLSQNNPVPSPKQTLCPNCKLPIPKSFKYHKECGWSQ